MYSKQQEQSGIFKFKPGLVGGHCISVDPYYLNTKENPNKVKIISSSRAINDYVNVFLSKLRNIYFIKEKALKNERYFFNFYKENRSEIQKLLYCIIC